MCIKNGIATNCLPQTFKKGNGISQWGRRNEQVLTSIKDTWTINVAWGLFENTMRYYCDRGKMVRMGTFYEFGKKGQNQFAI